MLNHINEELTQLNLKVTNKLIECLTLRLTLITLIRDWFQWEKRNKDLALELKKYNEQTHQLNIKIVVSNDITFYKVETIRSR